MVELAATLFVLMVLGPPAVLLAGSIFYVLVVVPLKMVGYIIGGIFEVLGIILAEIADLLVKAARHLPIVAWRVACWLWRNTKYNAP